MADIGNIGSSSSSIPSNESASYLTSSQFKALPSSVQADLIQAFSTDELNADFPINSTANTPSLASPFADDSMNNFFKMLTAAKRGLSQQLAASDYIDQSTRSKDSQAASVQAAALQTQLIARTQAIAAAQLQATQATTQLQQQLNTMQTQQNNEKTQITNLNNGNANEKQQFLAFTQAYTNYFNAVSSLPDVTSDAAATTWSINNASNIDTYNVLTSNYKIAVDTFNSYLSTRYNQITSYNTATSTYNSKISGNNQTIQNFITQYNLSSFISTNNISIPAQSTASTRSTSNYLYTQKAGTSVSASDPIPITVPFPVIPRNTANTIATNGPPTIATIPTFATYDASSFYTPIYDNLYSKNVAPIDTAIYSNTAYWGFLTLQILHRAPDSTPDPLLNFKPIVRRLVQATIINPTQPIQTGSSGGAGGLSIEAIGLGSPHIQKILGKAAISQAIDNLNLVQLTQDQKDQLVNQILTLSAGLIGTNSLESLLPSVGPIANLLAILPKDSPIISLLFSVTFSNSIQQAIGDGLTASALQTLVQSNPLLQNLSQEDLANLTAALNVGLLLVSAKLLESNLGLPGLLTTILPSLLPPDLQVSFLEQVNQTQVQTQTTLLNQLEANFLNQGFPVDQAVFLAQFSANLNNQGLLAPASSSVDINVINESLLLDSIKANLLLSANANTNLPMQSPSSQINVNSTQNNAPTDPNAAVNPKAIISDLQKFVLNQQASLNQGNTAHTILSDLQKFSLSQQTSLNDSINRNTILSNAQKFNQNQQANLNDALNSNSILSDLQKFISNQQANLNSEINGASLLSDLKSFSVMQQSNLNDSINANSISNSIASDQILNLAQADAIAQQALERTFRDEESHSVNVSTNQFRSDLETNLQDLGVSSSDASTIAREAVIVPKRQDLSQVNNSQETNTVETPSTPPSPATTIPGLSRSQLITILELMFPKLVSPHIQEELTQLVTLKLADTFFGNPNPDAQDIGGVKSPISLINTLKNQLFNLKVQQDNKQAVAVSDAFKETLITTTDFPAFALKVMDPAYSLIYSANTGIMYAGISQPSNLNNWKRSTDIPV